MIEHYPTSEQRFVTCIMPTRDRSDFIPKTVQYFLRQDYKSKELVIVDDGTTSIEALIPKISSIRYIHLGKKITIGAKRNLACELAKGDIIVHWDDDDWHADWRLTYQATELKKRKADICGLRKVLYLDLNNGQAWKFIFPLKLKDWVAGNTLCYKKSYWQSNPFLELNIGEDTRFLCGTRKKKLIALSNPKFMVGIIHKNNVSPKLRGSGWYSLPPNYLTSLIGADLKSYRFRDKATVLIKNNRSVVVKKNEACMKYPLVSCVMPTHNRRSFVLHAIQFYLGQDYQNRELIIIDDGSDPVRDIIPNDPDIHYFQFSKRFSLGTKRNIACSMAKGQIVILWDDDDWHGNHRVSHQVNSIINNKSDITALKNTVFFSTSDHKFWSCKPALFERMCIFGVLGGTAAFRKKIWSDGCRFPDCSLAEEAAFIKEAVLNGARLNKLDNDGTFIYVRHNLNTWRFETGKYLDRDGWHAVSQPAFISEENLGFFDIKENKKKKHNGN